MSFTAADKTLAHVAKILPRDAMVAWCNAANEGEELGLDRNDCVRAGWDEVGKSWHRPGGRGRYVRKDMPTAGDVHVDAPLGAKPKKKPAIVKSVIVKTDDEQRMVYGWASVISEDGEPVVDTQGDVIEPEELLKATTEFMADARLAKAMHEGDGIGEVIHSFPLTAELAKSLGIDTAREGWIVGVKVHDDEVWAKVKSKELGSFSIGGFGERETI